MKGLISPIDDCIISSPSFLVPKNSEEKRKNALNENKDPSDKKNAFRLVSDFRFLNSLVQSNLDNTAVKGIQESLDRIGSNNYMSSFDISSFFWSIVVNKSSRRYLGLSLPFTPITYCYNVIPMGVLNRPSPLTRPT